MQHFVPKFPEPLSGPELMSRDLYKNIKNVGI